jgi:hypothetical protein
MRLKMLGLFFAVVGLAGCKEVTIKDGRVPQEYLKQAKQLEGKYYGTFDGKKAQIEIYFEGDRPILSYKDSRSDDPLDASCDSKIDLLKKVILYKKSGNYVVDQAFFGFHPGSCRLVRGRNIELDFSGKDKLTMSIYEYSDYVQRCDPGPPPNYGNNCRTEEVPHYISGRFAR